MSKTTTNPFEDPVSYLRELGIEAELVSEDATPLPAAA